MLDNTREFDQNRETITRLLSNFQRECDKKCYCPCKSCNGLKKRTMKIKTTKRHCRENTHIEGGFAFHLLVSCFLYFFHN